MSKHSINYEDLCNKIEKRVYKLSEVKHRIEKVAFDIVRFTDNDTEKLWQIQSADDGEYIVSLYDNKEETKKTSNWEVALSKTSSDINIFYKGEQITKLACEKLDLPKEDISLIKNYLPEKLSSNKNLVKSLLNDLNEQTRKSILNKFPELNQ